MTRAFFQCQKALIRSHLWDAEARIDRQAEGIASLGAIFADQIEGLSTDRAETIIEDSNKTRLW